MHSASDGWMILPLAKETTLCWLCCQYCYYWEVCGCVRVGGHQWPTHHAYTCKPIGLGQARTMHKPMMRGTTSWSCSCIW